MRSLLITGLVLSSLFCQGQYGIKSNAYLNTNGNFYGWTNAGDSLLFVQPTYIKYYKPLALKGYTTASLPSGIPIGSILFNTDSAGLPAYYDGSIYHYMGQAGGGVTSITNTDGTLTISPTSGTVFAAINLSHANTWAGKQTFTSSNAFLQGGNAFGVIATLGTTDNNALEFRTNGVNAMSLFPGGAVLVGSTGVAPAQTLGVNGTLGVAGTITCNASSGLSMLSGFSFNSFGANNVANAFFWGMNNNYNNAGNYNFQNFSGTMAFGSGSSTVNQLIIQPTINNTGGTTTVRGIYYNPTLTSVTGTTNIAFENTSGSVLFRAIPTATGTPTLLAHQTDSTMTQLSISALAALLPAVPIKYAHTIFTPTTGGTVNLVNNQYNIINPAGALLALTVNLPSSPNNNDVVYIKFTQTITTVTYANGTVVDGITGPAAGGLVVLTYDSGTTSWY